MSIRRKDDSGNEKGIAMVTTLLLTLLLSMLVAGMLVSSTADVLISSNDIRTNQAFYVAEAGLHRAAGWFNAKFGTDPSGNRFFLPQQFASNTAGEAGKLSYTNTPVYLKGVSGTSKPSSSAATEQSIPTSVKVLANGTLQNVVLAGDSSNTYPINYSVKLTTAAGTVVTKSYAGQVVNDFASNLFNQVVNQSDGNGKFSVKATLVSIIPPSDGNAGSITWLLQSTGRLVRGGDTTLASTTLSAYITARVTPVTERVLVESGSEQVGAAAGLIARGKIQFNANGNRVDSYKSSLGAYGISLSASTYQGQIGTRNIGSRGDLHTNNETINNEVGYIDIDNGTITGKAYSRLPAPGLSLPSLPLLGLPLDFDAISIDINKVSDGRGGNFSEADKIYGQANLNFPLPPDPTPPSAGAPNYNYSRTGVGTLPAGNYNNVSITKGQLTVPPGNYGDINVTSQGTIVLGVPGQHSTYNFQSFSSSSQAKIVFRGPVTINVLKSLNVGAQSSIADPSMPASAIRWNFKGTGSGQDVSIGGGGDTLGVFYCPNNDLSILGSGDFYGAIVARSVDIRGSGSVHIDEDAMSGATVTKLIFSETTNVTGYTAKDYKLRRITQQIN